MASFISFIFVGTSIEASLKNSQVSSRGTPVATLSWLELMQLSSSLTGLGTCSVSTPAIKLKGKGLDLTKIVLNNEALKVRGQLPFYLDPEDGKTSPANALAFPATSFDVKKFSSCNAESKFAFRSKMRL